MIEPTVIYEDSHYLVLEKPAGLVVMPGAGHKDLEKTLAGWVIRQAGPSHREVNRWGLVHRLDKDVSGVMVVAKTPQAYEDLVEQFKRREVGKEYLALVWGRTRPAAERFARFFAADAAKDDTDYLSKEVVTRSQRFGFGRGYKDSPASPISPGWEIRAPIARHPKKRLRFMVDKKGKEALTEIRVLREFGEFRGEVFSLFEVFPKTGRTHQIRVHLQFAGHPIVGDAYYSGRKRCLWAKKNLRLVRPFLHAHKLGFKMIDGTAAEFVSELPEELKRILKKLKV